MVNALSMTPDESHAEKVANKFRGYPTAMSAVARRAMERPVS